MFLHIPYTCKIEQPDTYHIMGLLSLNEHHREMSSGSTSCQEFVPVIVCTFDTVYCFQYAYIIISTTIDDMH